MAEPNRSTADGSGPSRIPAPGIARGATGAGTDRVRSRWTGLQVCGEHVSRLRLFARDARGATAIEYAMIGGLIFAVIAGSLRLYGSKVDSVYGRIGTAMAQVN